MTLKAAAVASAPSCEWFTEHARVTLREEERSSGVIGKVENESRKQWNEKVCAMDWAQPLGHVKEVGA